MKKIIYIDNDWEDIAKKDFRHFKSSLSLYDQWDPLPKAIKEMEIKSDFVHLEKEEMVKLMFDTNIAICTRSMFTFSHMGSAYQLRNWLELAGKEGIKNKIYINSTDYMDAALRDLWTYAGAEDIETQKYIEKALKDNFIISVFDDESQQKEGEVLDTFFGRLFYKELTKEEEKIPFMERRNELHYQRIDVKELLKKEEFIK